MHETSEIIVIKSKIPILISLEDFLFLKSIVYFQWFLITDNNAKINKEPKCEYGIEGKVLTAYCSMNFLDEFPTNLKSEIGGLYLTMNSIAEIDDDTFKNYPSIKYLYLDHNSGLQISSQAFAPLTKLHTLDLSYNRVVDISNIYLPTSLVHLYLDKMKIEKLPINSLHNLKVLSLRKNHLDQIPSFEGVLPSLERLDLSENKLENFKLDSLAGLCNLKVLNTSNKLSIKNDCECLKLKEWIKSQNVNGSNINCKSTERDQVCNTSPSNAFLEGYELCRKEEASRRNGIVFYCVSIVSIGSIIFVICFSCVILYIFCNRKNYSDDTIRAYICCEKRAKQRKPMDEQLELM